MAHGVTCPLEVRRGFSFLGFKCMFWVGSAVCLSTLQGKFSQLLCSAVPSATSPKNRDKTERSFIVPIGGRGQGSRLLHCTAHSHCFFDPDPRTAFSLSLSSAREATEQASGVYAPTCVCGLLHVSALESHGSQKRNLMCGIQRA